MAGELERLWKEGALA